MSSKKSKSHQDISENVQSPLLRQESDPYAWSRGGLSSVTPDVDVQRTSEAEWDVQVSLARAVVGGEEMGFMEDNGKVFEDFFELTSERLLYMYENLTKLIHIESLDFSKISLELRDAGVRVGQQELFRLKSLFHAADMDKDGHISFDEFEVIVQSLKLALLLKKYTQIQTKNPFASCDEVIECYSYNLGKLKHQIIPCDLRLPKRLIHTSQTLSEFMYLPREKVFPNRWINLNLSNSLGIKALAIKYRLHPLALEDALLNDISSRAKFENFISHLLLTIPVLQLTVFNHIASDSKSEGFLGRTSSSIRRRDSYYGSFQMKRKESLDFGFSVKFESSDTNGKEINRRNSGGAKFRRTSNPDRYTKLGDDIEGGIAKASVGDDYDLSRVPLLSKFNAFIFVVRSNHLHVTKDIERVVSAGSNTEMNTVISAVPERVSEVFDQTKKDLGLPYSKVTAKSSLHVAYSLLESIVKSYSAIVEQYSMYTDALMNEDASEPYPGSQSNKNLHQELKRELNKLKRCVTPVLKVLDIFSDTVLEINSKEAGEENLAKNEIYVYIRDLKSNLEQLFDEINDVMEVAKQLHFEQHQKDERKMTIIMTRLTIIATIFLPAQFLTGVFGMNFEFMPELKYKYGYAMFWALCVVSSVTLYYALKRGYG